LVLLCFALLITPHFGYGEPGGAESEGAESGGSEPRGTASSGDPAGASPRLSPRLERLSPQQQREWFDQRKVFSAV
ncbi:unnamed protein product, partial [Closterium sp. NIES-53]